MKTLADQIGYESYSKQHYAKLSHASVTERRLNPSSTRLPTSEPREEFVPILRTKMAYVIAITFLATLTVSRVVVAMAGGGGGGGGGYLVK